MVITLDVSKRTRKLHDNRVIVSRDAFLDGNVNSEYFLEKSRSKTISRFLSRQEINYNISIRGIISKIYDFMVCKVIPE